MANFPTSVYSPSVVSDGQTISASRDNGQDAEITAIESGYLSGTAPLNSSNSTVANLSVTGGSTLATLNITSGSTLAALTVSGAFTLTSASRHACRVTHSATQNLPNNTLTGLSFDTETSDDPGMHSTSVNSSRLAFSTGGTFLVGGQASFGPISTAGSYRQMRIRLNDATDLAILNVPAGTVSMAAAPYHAITTVYKASTGDYVTLLCSQDSGSTMSISSGAPQVVFWTALVGA